MGTSRVLRGALSRKALSVSRKLLSQINTSDLFTIEKKVHFLFLSKARFLVEMLMTLGRLVLTSMLERLCCLRIATLGTATMSLFPKQVVRPPTRPELTPSWLSVVPFLIPLQVPTPHPMVRLWEHY